MHDKKKPHYDQERDKPRVSSNPTGAKIMGDILKKAASIGAGVYVTAEDAVSKTLNTVQIPPKLLRETIESFFEDYAITIHAELKLKRKDGKKRLDKDED